jgi:hypothetical protein
MQAINTAVRHSIVVDVPVESAFEVYVGQSFTSGRRTGASATGDGCSPTSRPAGSS